MYTPQNDGFVATAISKVTDVMRALFDSRTQTLIEAGYITKCAEFTPEFDNAVRIIMLETHGEAIEALAKAKLDAQKVTK